MSAPLDPFASWTLSYPSNSACPATHLTNNRPSSPQLQHHQPAYHPSPFAQLIEPSRQRHPEPSSSILAAHSRLPASSDSQYPPTFPFSQMPPPHLGHPHPHPHPSSHPPITAAYALPHLQHPLDCPCQACRFPWTQGNSVHTPAPPASSSLPLSGGPSEWTLQDDQPVYGHQQPQGAMYDPTSTTYMPLSGADLAQAHYALQYSEPAPQHAVPIPDRHCQVASMIAPAPRPPAQYFQVFATDSLGSNSSSDELHSSSIMSASHTTVAQGQVPDGPTQQHNAFALLPAPSLPTSTPGTTAVPTSSTYNTFPTPSQLYYNMTCAATSTADRASLAAASGAIGTTDEIGCHTPIYLLPPPSQSQPQDAAPPAVTDATASWAERAPTSRRVSVSSAMSVDSFGPGTAPLSGSDNGQLLGATDRLELSETVPHGRSSIGGGGKAAQTVAATPTSQRAALPKSPKSPRSPRKTPGDRLVYNRKADRMKLIESHVGFEPTESEYLSPHAKRRLYMNSLEQYILFLYHQLRLVGQEPMPIPQLHEYKGINTRSLRTMLVHMENSARKMNIQARDAEKTGALLHNRLMAWQEAPLSMQLMRYSSSVMASAAPKS